MRVVVVALAVFMCQITCSSATVIAGANNFGQCGVNASTGNQRMFTTFPLASTATLIATGPYHTVAAVPSALVLYAFGYNGHGELGTGKFLSKDSPVTVSIPSPISQVSVGGGHTFVITTDKRLFSFGRNHLGQLCLGNFGQGVNTPQEVIITGGAKSAALGWAHSLIVNTNGDLFACGDNSYGQLGLPGYAAVSNVLVPIQNTFYSKNVKAVACGAKHSFVQRTTNTMDSFGNNEHGQLCLGNGSITSFVPSSVPSPTISVNSLGTATSFAAGLAHSLFVVSGKVYGCGLNFNGQLGLASSDVSDVSVARAMSNILEFAVGVAAGWSHSVVRTSGGVYTVGGNTRGQLGYGGAAASSVAKKITLSFAPVDIVAGGELSVIVG